MKASALLLVVDRRRRPSPHPAVHKRLPVCQPFSIQDQSVRGSDHCRVLSAGQGENARSSSLTLFAPARIQTFISNFVLSSAEVTSLLRLLRPSCPSLSPSFSSWGSKQGQRCLSAGSVGGSRSRRGHVPGAECVSEALGAGSAGRSPGGSGGGMQLPPSPPSAVILHD